MIIIRYNPIREESDGNVQDGRLLQRCEGPFFCILPYAILTIKTLKNPAFYTLLYI